MSGKVDLDIFRMTFTSYASRQSCNFKTIANGVGVSALLVPNDSVSNDESLITRGGFDTTWYTLQALLVVSVADIEKEPSLLDLSHMTCTRLRRRACELAILPAETAPTKRFWVALWWFHDGTASKLPARPTRQLRLRQQLPRPALGADANQLHVEDRTMR